MNKAPGDNKASGGIIQEYMYVIVKKIVLEGKKKSSMMTHKGIKKMWISGIEIERWRNGYTFKRKENKKKKGDIL